MNAHSTGQMTRLPCHRNPHIRADEQSQWPGLAQGGQVRQRRPPDGRGRGVLAHADQERRRQPAVPDGRDHRHCAGRGGRPRTPAAQRGDRRGGGVVAVLRTPGQEPGAVSSFGSICGGLAAARLIRPARPIHRHPAQRGRARAGAGGAGHRHRGAAAVGAVVPRPRRPAADRRMGGDGGRRRAELQRLVGGPVSRPGHPDRGARVQLHGDALRDMLDPRTARAVRL